MTWRQQLRVGFDLACGNAVRYGGAVLFGHGTRVQVSFFVPSLKKRSVVSAHVPADGDWRSVGGSLGVRAREFVLQKVSSHE